MEIGNEAICAPLIVTRLPVGNRIFYILELPKQREGDKVYWMNLERKSAVDSLVEMLSARWLFIKLEDDILI